MNYFDFGYNTFFEGTYENLSSAEIALSENDKNFEVKQFCSGWNYAEQAARVRDEVARSARRRASTYE